MVNRLQYYRRIFRSYLLPGQSQLTFWHEAPAVNAYAPLDALGEYYMGFESKADYAGHYDDAGIPMLNYHGRIGLQYNPIAIAQWGLGNYNLFRRTRDDGRRAKFLGASDWLRDHLEQNRFGMSVWNHHFDWEYRQTLKSPWYSALAQGQGISLLARAYLETQRSEYLDCAQRAFDVFLAPIEGGGVTYTDEIGDLWFEEYIVSPPTHILNGFIWATWGVYDYYLAMQERTARELFESAVGTLLHNLERYDMGYWSLYELAGTRMPMVASPFYHRLHIAQLRIMHALTGKQKFAEFAERWESYGRSRAKRTRALCYKSAFKLCYY